MWFVTATQECPLTLPRLMNTWLPWVELPAAGLTLATTPFPGATWACPHGERRSTPLCIQRPPKGYSRMPKGEVT
jgi:hypothetical protein